MQDFTGESNLRQWKTNKFSVDPIHAKEMTLPCAVQVNGSHPKIKSMQFDLNPLNPEYFSLGGNQCTTEHLQIVSNEHL